MQTYEEAQARRAEFERAVTDASAREVATTCPLSRTGCAGRSCACAMRTDVGWICGLTSSRKGARAVVVVLGSSSSKERDANATRLLSDALGALSW